MKCYTTVYRYRNFRGHVIFKECYAVFFLFQYLSEKHSQYFYPLYPHTVFIHIFRINDPAISETAIYLLCML